VSCPDVAGVPHIVLQSRPTALIERVEDVSSGHTDGSNYDGFRLSKT